MATVHKSHDLKNETLVSNIPYIRWIALACLGLVVLGGVYFGYSWYVTKREQAAQKIFSECMHEYMEAYSGQTAWVNVQELSKLGYEQHASSSMAPYFLALQADALVQENKKQEAVAVLDTMLAHMSSTSPVYGVYQLKRALLMLDTDDALGLEQLKKLAQNSSNKNRDAALYYLGLYHWSKDSFDQARESWQELVDLMHNQEANSPWAVLAQKKLQQAA